MTSQLNPLKLIKNRRSVVLLVILVMIASSCAPATTEPPPTQTPVPTQIPTQTPFPTATSTPFVPKATLKIFSHFPMTGDFGNTGTDLTNAVDLAIRQLAEPLRTLGYAVELVSYDDQNEIDQAVANANEIVADPDILCGVGHYFSRVTIQTSEIYHKAGLAIVCPSCTNPTVTERKYVEVNRVVGRDDMQGKAGAQFIKEQGLSTVFVITQNSDYALKNADSFKKEARRINITVVGDMKTDVMENFESFITRVLNTEAAAVYFSTTTSDQAGAFFREARAAGYLGLFLGPDGLNSPALPNAAGPLLVDGAGTYFTSTAAQAKDYPETLKFRDDFETAFGSQPMIFIPQAYDATGVCMQAIEQASLAKNGEIPTRKEVANAIRSLAEYKGITGTFSFNKEGDPNLARYFVYKVTSVDPDKWGDNPMVAYYEISPP